MKKGTKFITLEMLREMEVCEASMEWFEKHFGKRVTVDKAFRLYKEEKVGIPSGYITALFMEHPELKPDGLGDLMLDKALEGEEECNIKYVFKFFPEAATKENIIKVLAFTESSVCRNCFQDVLPERERALFVELKTEAENK